MTYISWSIDFVKVDMLFVSVPALFAQSLVKEYYKYYTAKSLQTPHTFESLHIQGSRYRSPLSPFAQKNKIWHTKIINWRKQVAKKISPELPTTESYNCRACLSHLDCIIRQLVTQLSIRKR